MKKLGIFLLFVIGAWIGPWSLVEARFFSGKQVDTARIYSAPRTGEPGAWTSPATVKLDPSMNPIAFEFDMNIPRPETLGGDRNSYDTALAKDGKALWSKEYSFGARPTGFRRGIYTDTHATRLNTFNVRESGDYVFTMAPKSEGLEVLDIKLVVKRNVAEMPVGATIAGCVMMLAAILLTLKAMRDAV